MKIVVLEAASLGNGVSLEGLSDLGELVVYDKTKPEEIAERVTDAQILVINKLPMNEKNLSTAQNLQMITITATGTDNFDLDYLHKRGIRVANMRGYSTLSVAQHTFALALHLLEQTAYFDESDHHSAYRLGKRGIPSALGRGSAAQY